MKTVALLKKPQTAFSLTDLLVVIAVLGVLALTVLARPPSKARQNSCAANLRQIGEALYMYADENNGWLPPGNVPVGLPSPNDIDALTPTQTPAYRNDRNSRKYLVYYLSTYFSLPSPASVGTTSYFVANVFICPAYERSLPMNSVSGTYNPALDNYANAACYSVTRQLNNGEYGLGSGLPFGSQGDPSRRPHKLANLGATNGGPSTVWALADFETNAVSNPAGLGSVLSYMAKNPVHGNSRNFLFFDNHVGSRKVTGYQNY